MPACRRDRRSRGGPKRGPGRRPRRVRLLLEQQPRSKPLCATQHGLRGASPLEQPPGRLTQPGQHVLGEASHVRLERLELEKEGADAGVREAAMPAATSS
jgi:hypothetical protein